LAIMALTEGNMHFMAISHGTNIYVASGLLCVERYKYTLLQL